MEYHIGSLLGSQIFRRYFPRYLKTACQSFRSSKLAPHDGKDSDESGEKRLGERFKNYARKSKLVSMIKAADDKAGQIVSPVQNYFNEFEENVRKHFDKTDTFSFPVKPDIVIIGGGLLGSSIGYWLKSRAREIEVVIVERDPSFVGYIPKSFIGMVKQNFSIKQNLEMAQFGVEFLRNIKELLFVRGMKVLDPKVNFEKYLFLANNEDVNNAKLTYDVLKHLDVQSLLLSASELAKIYPWMNVNGIALGCHCVEKEGWFDPLNLLLSLKAKNGNLGIHYLPAEARSFELSGTGRFIEVEDQTVEYERPNKIHIETEMGESVGLQSYAYILAGGWECTKLAETAMIGKTSGLLRHPLPVKFRTRHVFGLHVSSSPLLGFPVIEDPSGLLIRREGLGGHYVCTITTEELFTSEKLQIDYFYHTVLPLLVNRIPFMKEAQLLISWMIMEDHNTHDNLGIFGQHTLHENIVLATGFGINAPLFAPAIGRAAMELLIDKKYLTIDMTPFHFDRIICDEKFVELCQK